MKDQFQNNPSARAIINSYIKKGGLDKYKYNFSVHNQVESITGEPSDRSPYDVGSEMESKINHDNL
jgi:hypothetical protein